MTGICFTPPGERECKENSNINLGESQASNNSALFSNLPFIEQLLCASNEANLTNIIIPILQIAQVNGSLTEFHMDYLPTTILRGRPEYYIHLTCEESELREFTKIAQGTGRAKT